MPGWALLVVSAAAAAGVYVAFVLWLALRGRRGEAAALARLVPDCAGLVGRLLRDERVPRRQKALLGALVAYLALPFDLVPDFVPVAGQLDDAIVAAVVLRSLVRSGGAGLIEEHWRGPAEGLALVLRLAGR